MTMTPEEYREAIVAVSWADRPTISIPQKLAAATVLADACAVGDACDEVKKWIFHAKPDPTQGSMEIAVPWATLGQISEDGYLSTERQENAVLYALGIFGEGAEVARRILQIVAADGQADNTFVRDKIRLEIGDLLWYVDRLMRLMDMPMGEVLQANFDKLSARYPNGFGAAEKRYDHDDTKDEVDL